MRCAALPPPPVDSLGQPIRLDPRWQTETVLTLAHGIVIEQAYDRLPILADALEDAGCDNFDLLNHMRADGEHWPGCRAFRAVLQTSLTLPGGVEMLFAWCPAGTFKMGAPESESGVYSDETPHKVTLSRAFYCGVYPVTQAQWRAVIGTAPSWFKGDDRPVESVRWDDAVAFCAKLREMTGREVRLPTEAEWEYACRGGTTTPFYWGRDLSGLQANCDGRTTFGKRARARKSKGTSAVGSFAAEYPHPWGLADVLGNVWEWCSDMYDEDYYTRSPKKDPVCLEAEEDRRVVRGGGWSSSSINCRAAQRNKFYPAAGYNSNGFRVVFCAD